MTLASVSQGGHIPLPAAASGQSAQSHLGYSVQAQTNMDNNTVDLTANAPTSSTTPCATKPRCAF